MRVLRLVRSVVVITAVSVAAVSCNGSWTNFTSDVGSFKVAMPGAPKERIETVQTTAGPLRVHWFGVTPRPWWPRKPVMYLVSYAELPRVATPSGDVELAEARGRLSDVLSKELDLNFEHEQRGSFKGHPSLDLTFNRNDGTVAKARTVLVGRRIYSLAVAGPKERVASDSDGMLFLSSLEIL